MPSHVTSLVKDGKPLAVLVTPDEPSAVTESATQLIRRTIEKMSGALLDIATESAGSGQRLPVYVGQTRFAEQKGIRQQDLEPEEIVLMATGEHVLVVGNEGPAGPGKGEVQEGTYFAAVELLQRLGVRWLWPGPSGEAIPHTTNVSLENVEYRHNPKVFSRRFRIQVHGMPYMGAALQAKFGRVNGSTDVYDWPQNMRLGGSRTIKATHAFGDWYERFFEDHPDWFARGGDDGKHGESREFGRRHTEQFAPGGARVGTFGWMNNPSRCKICVSNPEVLEQVVADAKAYYNSVENPRNASYSLTPNDGRACFCMCPDCRSLDHPDGTTETSNFFTPVGNGEFQGTTVNHVSLTERYVTFWNRVAERLSEETPGMTVGSLAYSVYRSPPIATKLHPDLAIGYVGGGYINKNVHQAFLEGWKAWTEKCSQMFWRPNSMQDGHGFPLVWATRMGHDIKMMVETGLVAVDMPNIHHHWGTQGLNYYMLAQMLWDHTQDPTEIIEDYCKAGFGTAAPMVRRYYDQLEKLTEKHAGFVSQSAEEALRALDATAEEGTRGETDGKQSPYEVVWTDEVIEELDQLLGQAAGAVPAGSPEAERVAILREGIDFARVHVRVERAFHKYLVHATSPENAKLRGLDAATFHLMGSESTSEATFDLLYAVAKAEQWMYPRESTMAVGVVEGYPWWWRGMRPASPVHANRFMVRAIAKASGRYLLTIPSYSRDGRFEAVQFSMDGTTWSAEEPYRIEHEFVVKDDAVDTLQVRLLLVTTTGRKWMEPVPVTLPR